MRLALAALLLTSVSAPALAQTDAELRAIIARQQAQIDALTARLEAIEADRAAPPPPPVAAAAPPPTKSKEDLVVTRFRGSPEFSTEGGWRFKVRGRVMHDTSAISSPGELEAGDLGGLRTRFRRLRLGVEGDMPGGFAYKGEIDFANSSVSVADVTLSYRASKKAPLELTIGHAEPLDGFEQFSSTRYISFLERSAFNEAFGNSRRLGGYATYISPDSEFRLSAGVFNDTVNADKANDELVLASRATWGPKVGDTQLHFGVNAAHRSYQTNQLAFAYRARPFTNSTDTRFVNTGTLAVRDDLILGAEFLAIHGPFHFFAEAQRLRADTIRPGAVLAGREETTGRRTGFNPTFFGGVAEIGYFFTGESRGYKNGVLDRTRPLNPIDKGGIGAISLNLRYDHLDLSDSARGGAVAADLIDGGRQTGYLASLIWQPTDYVRFTLQYTHGEVEGGPLQAAVNPLSPLPASERGFDFDMAALRAAWDF
jgi:phosphate-selective porin OprO and OprP